MVAKSAIGEPEVGRYRLHGKRAIRPIAIDDDGTKTYMAFAPDRPLPAIFAIDALGREPLVKARGGSSWRYRRPGIGIIRRLRFLNRGRSHLHGHRSRPFGKNIIAFVLRYGAPNSGSNARCPEQDETAHHHHEPASHVDATGEHQHAGDGDGHDRDGRSDRAKECTLQPGDSRHQRARTRWIGTGQLIVQQHGARLTRSLRTGPSIFGYLSSRASTYLDRQFDPDPVDRVEHRDHHPTGCPTPEDPPRTLYRIVEVEPAADAAWLVSASGQASPGSAG